MAMRRASSIHLEVLSLSARVTAPIRSPSFFLGRRVWNAASRVWSLLASNGGRGRAGSRSSQFYRLVVRWLINEREVEDMAKSGRERENADALPTVISQ